MTIFSVCRPDWASAPAHDGMSGCLLAGTVAGFWHKVARAVHLTLPHRQWLRQRQGKEQKKEKARRCVTELTKEIKIIKDGLCDWVCGSCEDI